MQQSTMDQNKLIKINMFLGYQTVCVCVCGGGGHFILVKIILEAVYVINNIELFKTWTLEQEVQGVQSEFLKHFVRRVGSNEKKKKKHLKFSRKASSPKQKDVDTFLD